MLVNRIPFLLLLFMVSATALFGQTRAQPVKGALVPIQQQTVANLKKAKKTGDPDVDYVNLVYVHTEGTQRLLKGIIDLPGDSALTQAAQTMLSAAETDLATLEKLRTGVTPAARNTTFARRQNRVVAAISEKVRQSASAYKLTKNPETNIRLLLSDQRQDAMNLATNYLLFGKNTDIRNFAQQAVEKAKLDLDILKNLPNRSK